MARFPLVIAFSFSASAWADPLPVHTATRRVPSAPTTEQRLSLADAVAEVFSAVVPEVLNGRETRERLNTLDPEQLACDQASCAPSVSGPLRGRALVLLRLTVPRRGRARVWVGVVNNRGEIVAQNEAEDTVGPWTDAVALGRVVARPVAENLRPRAMPDAAPTPIPMAAAAMPPVAPVHTPEVVLRYRRRPLEIGIGGGLVVGGLALASFGLASVARDGDLARELPNGVGEFYSAGARDYVFLGVGAVAVGVGVYFLIDGLRRRPDGASATRGAVIPLVSPSLAGLAWTRGF